MRQCRQEFILALIRFAQRGLGALAAGDFALRRLVQARVVDGDRRLRGDADDEPARRAR